MPREIQVGDLSNDWMILDPLEGDFVHICPIEDETPGRETVGPASTEKVADLSPIRGRWDPETVADAIQRGWSGNLQVPDSHWQHVRNTIRERANKPPRIID